METQAVQSLLATQAIERVVYRYCRGVDRLDRELVRSCFWPEACDEHGSFSGTRDEMVSWLFDRMLLRYDWTFHFIGNLLVDLGPLPGIARSEAYGIAKHRARSERREHNLTTGFRYVDDWEERAGEWRILRRRSVLEWSQADDPASWWEAPPSHQRGRRDFSDPVYSPIQLR